MAQQMSHNVGYKVLFKRKPRKIKVTYTQKKKEYKKEGIVISIDV